MIVSVVQGGALIGRAATRTYWPEQPDILGQIEDQGWHLKRMSLAFIENGSSATKHIIANAGSTEVTNHGTAGRPVRVPPRRAVSLRGFGAPLCSTQPAEGYAMSKRVERHKREADENAAAQHLVGGKRATRSTPIAGKTLKASSSTPVKPALRS